MHAVTISIVWLNFVSPVYYYYYQKKTRVRIWLYEDTRMQMEGTIIGFDEYMNIVLDESVEIDSKKNQRQEVGRILLKGDAITMIQYVCCATTFLSPIWFLSLDLQELKFSLVFRSHQNQVRYTHASF
jgi:small nuclear ribonucleoprotein E